MRAETTSDECQIHLSHFRLEEHGWQQLPVHSSPPHRAWKMPFSLLLFLEEAANQNEEWTALPMKSLLQGTNSGLEMKYVEILRFQAPGSGSPVTRISSTPHCNSRPSVLQLVRNLFGLRQSAQEGPETRADAQEQGNFGVREENSSLVPAGAESEARQPAGKELTGDHLADEPCGDATGDRIEEIHGELKDISLGGTPSSCGRRSPPTLDHSGMETGDSGDWALSDLSESGSCIGASVDEEEKQSMGSGATGEACGQRSGTGDAGGTSAERWPLGRPSVLQLVRNLFGLRQSVQEGPETRADAQERGDVGDREEDSSLVPAGAESETSQPAGKELTGDHPTDEPCGDATGDHMGEILGELKNSSLGGTPSSCGRRSPPMEMGDSGSFVNTAVGKDKTAQDPCNRISGREAERVGEASGDTGTWGKAGISQVPRADNEGIKPTAGPLAVIPQDFRAKEEREHLLKEDLNGGSPKAELSPWNKLINMYKQQWKLPVPKEHPVQLEMEDRATLNLTGYEFATPEPHLISSESSGTALIYRFPDDRAGETVGHFGRAQGDLRTNGLEAAEAD
ncbi:UNC5C-like protein isoform X3 [Dermochelys coriacea]|uniref:UNC5C-like protein isoform X3 n=1 Tax=Dermochelys coriacea TaxID=27794 RepID=UPI001CAA18F0|nr:UNC5C-like protein isoform X3 [Dermochelys coriacea]